MPRWLWWSPLVLGMLLLALFAFRAGWRVATLTETDVITEFAQQYVRDTAGDLSDCYATPGAVLGVWITVRCEGAAGNERLYHADRFGRQVFPDLPLGDPQA